MLSMKKHSQKTISLGQLAQLMQGQVDRQPELMISGIAPINEAGSGQITFLSGAKNYQQHLENLKSCLASAVIAAVEAPELDLPTIRVKNPYYGLVRALEFFHPVERPKCGIHPTAYVS